MYLRIPAFVTHTYYVRFYIEQKIFIRSPKFQAVWWSFSITPNFRNSCIILFYGYASVDTDFSNRKTYWRYLGNKHRVILIMLHFNTKLDPKKNVLWIKNLPRWNLNPQWPSAKVLLVLLIPRPTKQYPFSIKMLCTKWCKINNERLESNRAILRWRGMNVGI